MNRGMQEAVHDLPAMSGFTISEMKHRGEKTICCGEGGTVVKVFIR